MYFPYFRGRQYELLALKELAINDLLGNSVLPVVEPIKLSSTFASTIDAYIKSNKQIGVVCNLSVGESSKDVSLIDKLLSLLNEGVIVPCIIMNESAEDCLLKLNDAGISNNRVLVILQNRDLLQNYESIFAKNTPRFTLCPDQREFRRKAKSDKVIFEDRFKKRSRNADYPEDEFFSEDHLYFAEEGYHGFGDYSIIGDEFNERGFAPYAVAIHIVYFSQDKTLRIKHFTSITNDDISDVAGKFHEAVEKLAQFRQDNAPTRGIDILRTHYQNGTYPGLPTLKKLSIMHHLELMGKYLDTEAQA